MKCIRQRTEKDAKVARLDNAGAYALVTTGRFVFVNKQSYKRHRKAAAAFARYQQLKANFEAMYGNPRRTSQNVRPTRIPSAYAVTKQLS